MKPVSPVLPNENFKEIMIAETQEEYQTLPSLQCGNGVILSRWEIDGIELEKLEAEKTIYVFMLTFGQKPKAMILKVEKPEFPTKLNDKILEAVPFDTQYYLAKFAVTSEQFQILKDSRSIYAFMQTENQPIMPYLITVEKPVYPEPNALILARYDESLFSTTENLGLAPKLFNCDKCNSQIIGTDVTAEIFYDNPNISLFCSKCFEAMGEQGMYLPSTIEEYNKIKNYI